MQEGKKEVINQYFSSLRQLTEAERKEEQRLHDEMMAGADIDERRRNGVTWFPLEIKETGYGLGDYPYVVVRRPSGREHEHFFSAGKQAALFSRALGREGQYAPGTIHYVEGDNLKLILQGNDLPEWLSEGKIGIDLQHDDRSYREMLDAMRAAASAENSPTAHNRDVFLGLAAPLPLLNELPVEKAAHLNESQMAAVEAIVRVSDVQIVHGPPGTGKTTTLVEAIRQMSGHYKRLLVTSPSNAAADLLTEKLTEAGLSVIRVGNLSRIDEKVTRHTLEGKMAAHSLSKDIKELRKRADEFRRLAGKYKRNFGREEREQKKMLLHEVRQIRAQIRSMEDYLVEDLLQQARVIVSTMVGSINKHIEGRTFDVVFIDEAAQGLEPASWIPILKAKKVVLAGDPFQLPPTVKSPAAKKGGLEITLMEKSLSIPGRVHLLREQYRMNKAIMGFSNEYFYRGAIEAHESVAYHRLDMEDAAELTFIDTAGCGFDEEKADKGTSLYNSGEARVVARVLANTKDSLEHAGLWATVGVISPYKEQVRLLKENLEQGELSGGPNMDLNVNTIDSFQGQERDVIIISLVRSNSKNEIGFLADYRRMNVAMTRARKRLVIIGDSSTLANDEFYDRMLRYVEACGQYMSAYSLGSDIF